MPDIASVNDIPLIVETSIRKIKNIATLPAVAQKIMRLIDDPESNIEDLSKVIAYDPALCTRILKVINSSFYGMPQQIGSIDRAVTLLGLNAIKNIAIASSLNKVFKPNQIGSNFNAYDLWLHSIAVAAGARKVAKKAGFKLPDEAFLAGLVHDIGIMVEMQACPQEFSEIVDSLAKDQSLSFREVEQRVLGTTHEAFGAALCKSWNFPTHLGDVVGHHHDPTSLPESERLLPAIVHVADIMAAQIGAGYTRTVEVKVVAPELLDLLNLCESDIDTLMEDLPDAIQETQQLFGGV